VPVAVASAKPPAKSRPDASGQRPAATHKPAAKETEEMKLVQLVEVPRTVNDPELEFDVDLVQVGGSKRKPAMPWDNLRLSRRDFVLFGIGAATVIFALAVGKVLAWLFPLRKPGPPAPPAPYLEGDATKE
jgi:hypothetical protein